MKHFIKWKEEWVYLFTNNQVDKLKENAQQEIRRNHLAKVLLSHIEMYQIIIDNLLENENKDK